MDQVCDQCNKIVEGEDSFERAKNGSLMFQRNLAYLASMTADTCSLCYRLYGAFNLPAQPVFRVSLEDLATNQPKLHIAGGWETTTWPVSYLVYANKAEPAASIIKARPINLDVAADAAFEQATTWIEECDRDHEQCRTWRAYSAPVRLLDLSYSEGGTVFLHETHGRADPFVALSYCWGTKSFLRTTTRNLNRHLNGISVNDLPATIRDTITCVKRLGIQYLWVDSLCIVQDDDIEKYSEISRMKDFYRSAYLTISAASAESCQDGFLQKRRSLENALEVAVTCPDGPKSHIQLLTKHMPPHPRIVWCPGAEPVSYRAWTTQESMLSSRVLVYARTQSFWVCRERFASDGGNMTWAEFQGHAGWLWLDLKDDSSKNGDSQDGLVALDDFERYHSEWIALIHVYTMKRLTYQRDKLPALSALASIFRDKMRDEYVCGLWRRSLLFDITWGPNSYWLDRPPKDQVFSGPSWSWISYAHGIRYRDRWRDVDEIASVVSVTVTATYDFAPLGQVAAAEMIIDAPFFVLQLRTARVSDWILHTAVNTIDACTIVARFWPDYSNETQQRLAAAEGFHCALLHGTDIGAGDASGLVLIETEGNTFLRIGRFEFYSHTPKNGNWLANDGCKCSMVDDDSRLRRDREVVDALLKMPRHEIRIR